MRIVRRFVFTAAFLLGAVLLLTAAGKYGDFIYMFYPTIIREIQTILSEMSAKLPYLIWERVLLIAVIWAAITLLLDIVLQENLLRWVSGITMVLSCLLCLFVAASGLNYYAPSVAEGLRIEVVEEPTAAQVKATGAYYQRLANLAGKNVSRGENGIYTGADFDTLAQQLGSGMHNMTRTSYLFGGSTQPPKKLGFLTKYGISSMFCPFTGECCVSPGAEPTVLPYLMGVEAARRASVLREEDAAFISLLSCMASDSADYRYSGYLLAYRFCVQALEALDPLEAQSLAEGESTELTADLAACSYTLENAVSTRWLNWLASLKEDPSGTYPGLTSLLVSWHRHLTVPVALTE